MNTGTKYSDPKVGVSIYKSNVTMQGGACDIYTGLDNPKDVYIGGNSTVDFKKTARGIYTGDKGGNITIERGTYSIANATKRITRTSVAPAGNISIATADYSNVQAQKDRIPANYETICTPDTVSPLKLF